ncbi:MAG: hypothetical protein ACUVRS_01880 [Armatimonadota bacterium]
MAQSHKKTKQVIVWAVLLSLFLGVTVVENSATARRPKIPRTNHSPAIYELAGEFRIVFANLLWVKVEQYHHEYLLKNINWSENKELMGLLNIITTLDPQFVEAYEVGAYILANGYKDPVRAVRYLDQAITHNPKAWELHSIYAIILVRHLQNPRLALRHAITAYNLCPDKFYKARCLRLVRSIRRIISD